MFDAILEQYLASLAAAGKSLATQRAVRSDLTQFCTWWERTRQRAFDLTQVVERDLRAWKEVRQQDEGAAPATINRGLSTLRRLCAWAVEQRLLMENPTREIPDIPSTPVSPRSLPEQAVDALLRAARAEPDPRLRLRDEALLALLVYAGVRIQEACDVQLRDLDLASGTLVVRSGKGGKARRLPLHSEAQRTLSRYLQEVRCPEGLPPLAANRSVRRCLWGCSVRWPGVRWFQGSKHEWRANVLPIWAKSPPLSLGKQPPASAIWHGQNRYARGRARWRPPHRTSFVIAWLGACSKPGRSSPKCSACSVIVGSRRRGSI